MTSSDRGSATVELVVVTPVLLVVLAFIVALGRVGAARQHVDAAARDGARAAAAARSDRDAKDAGRAAVLATLVDEGVECRNVGVEVDVSDFGPGGAVVTTVTCHVSLEDLAGLALPSTRTVSASFTAPVDAFRGVR